MGRDHDIQILPEGRLTITHCTSNPAFCIGRSVRIIFPVAFCLGLVGASSAWSFVSFNPNGSGYNYPESANGRVVQKPSVNAFRIPQGAVRIDGMLDEAVWNEAEAATGFLVWDPDRGETPSEETVFKVLYDEDAVYFGIACLESDPSSITDHLCKRDEMADSDCISLYIDTYHDHNTGYNFRVNPSGAKEDRYVFSDGMMDRDWNTVWEAETHLNNKGWFAELRIPFSAIRFRHEESMTWGLQLYRYMHGRGEDTSWVTWDREERGFVSRFGELVNLNGITPARQLEVMPYVVQRSTDPDTVGVEEFDNFANFGADLTYAVTPDLTLNATFQPDFGQVEADPAYLNLSPFETWYDEKRPFFVEGSRFFSHPRFNMFYSRRIGTGEENSRIRAAGKLTGKTAGGISVAALYAATDITSEGQAHNFLKSGHQLSHFFVGRFGKEFSEGAHRVNIMQTAVYRSEDRAAFGDEETRDAWTGGIDFDLNPHDRMFNISGCVVGSVVDPAPDESDPSVSHQKYYGSGGNLSLRKLGGSYIGGVSGSWESGELDLNDAGYLYAPDEINAGGWIQYLHHPDRAGALVQNGNIEISLWRSWLYAGNEGYDLETGEEVWAYGEGYPSGVNVEFEGWGQFRNFWDAWFGLRWLPGSASKYKTRTFDGERGPLMKTSPGVEGWYGVGTDYRKSFRVHHHFDFWTYDWGTEGYRIEVGTRWNVTGAATLNLVGSYRDAHYDTQHLDNFENPGGGIGGVSYVFSEFDQKTVDLTARASLLFSRDLSLEFYAQPYLTVGDYYNPRQLTAPASHELGSTDGIPDFAAEDIHDYDFTYSQVNTNTVLRWEYRPGSTFYFVWKQGRFTDLGRTDVPDASDDFGRSLRFDDLVDNEPENVFLAKVTYWFTI